MQNSLEGAAGNGSEQLEHLRARVSLLETQLRAAGADPEFDGRERMLRLALESGRIGTWEWNIPTGTVKWSPGLEQIHGRAPGDLPSNVEAVLNEIHPEDRPQVEKSIHDAIESESDYHVEYRVTAIDGSIRWVEGRGRVLLGTSSVPEYMVGVCSDITTRKSAQQALEQRLRQLHALYRTAESTAVTEDLDSLYRVTLDRLLENTSADRAAILLFDPDGVMRFKAWTGLSGRYREAVDGHTPWLPATKDAEPVIVQDVETDPGMAAYLPVFRCENIRCLAFIPLRSQSGVIGKFMLYAASPYSFTADEVELAQTIADHVALGTLRFRSQQQLKDSEAWYRMLFENSNDAVAVSVEERYVYVNGAFAGMFGYACPEELVGVSLYDCVPPEYHPLIREQRQRRQAGGEAPSKYESRGRRRDGAEFALDVRASDFTMNGTTYTLAILRDVSRERESAALLRRQAEELSRSNERLQQFASIVSHDLKEPIRTVVTFAQMVARKRGRILDDEAAALIDHIVEGGKRMNDLVTDVLAYSQLMHAPVPVRVSTDLNAVFSAAVKNLDSAIQESGAKIVNEPLPQAIGESTELTQLFQNVLSNAIKYRGNRPPEIRVSARREGDFYNIAVQDNGIGIPADYVERIFEPFNRLHGREYPGSGIGLAICRKIVEKQGGSIWVESEPGKGSRFCFTLAAV